METSDQHADEWKVNLAQWEGKKSTQEAYRSIHKWVKGRLRESPILEIGSGLGKIKETIPEVITTDRGENPWVDRKESAYKLDWPDSSLGHIIMIDVWHHLRYQAKALQECHRALKPAGSLILVEPDISCLGWLVYGIAHHEGVNWNKLPDGKGESREKNPDDDEYFTCQASAHRNLIRREGEAWQEIQQKWEVKTVERKPMIRWLMSGGFKGPDFSNLGKGTWPEKLEALGKRVPWLLSTRIFAELQTKA
jgi:SAM-dependent methyltransferase